jgi:hypothetical protein
MVPMIEKNVTIVISGGGGCGICDDPIQKGEQVIRVIFEVPVIFTSVNVDKEMHLGCADRLAEVIRHRLMEAGWR